MKQKHHLNRIDAELNRLFERKIDEFYYQFCTLLDEHFGNLQLPYKLTAPAPVEIVTTSRLATRRSRRKRGEDMDQNYERETAPQNEEEHSNKKQRKEEKDAILCNAGRHFPGGKIPTELENLDPKLIDQIMSDFKKSRSTILE